MRKGGKKDEKGKRKGSKRDERLGDHSGAELNILTPARCNDQL